MKNNIINNITTWFKSYHTVENKVLFLILLFGIFFRLLTVTTIETGGDAANYWFAAKSLLYGLPYTLNHHTVRFGMIIPIMMSQCIFGTHPIVYYIMPLLFYVLQIIFLYRIVVRAYGINLAFACSLLLIFMPKMFSHAVQLKPDGFLAAYILISVWFIFKFYDTDKYSYWHLLAAALFMFMAYLTKETSLFFLPGMALCIWMMKKKFKYVVFFGSILFILFLCETTLYYLLADIHLGRAQIVAGSHLGSGNLLALPSVWSLLSRYIELNVFEKIYFFTYLASTFYILIRIKKIKPDITVLSLIIIPLIFFILLTFAVKSVSPIVPAMSFNPRHLVPAAPFMIFVIAYAIVSVKKTLKPYFAVSNLSATKSTTASVKLYALIIAMLSVLSTIVVIVALPHFPQAGRTGILHEHPFVETFRYYTLLNDAYIHGIPIIQEKVVANRWRKPVDAVQYYLNQGYTLQDACKRANVIEKDYHYCLSRVEQGDYKTFKIFTHIFLKIDSKTLNTFSFPHVRKTGIKSKSIAYIFNKPFTNKNDYITTYLSDENNFIVVMYEKPLRVKKMTVKKFFQ
ncbi:MAG: glycosyltransferase family 39 protein [Spirochaetota bacterium]